MPDRHAFPAGFLWGAATSAFQIEGAPFADGAGESIWDRWCAEPGRIRNGDDGRIGCGHYDRWREDVDLLRRLGVNSYRFSTAWTRILPDGTGRVNQPGLDFYDRLVDALLAAGIAPNLTLYHWDLPQALEDRGGWLAAASPDWFAEYAAVTARRLGDRVPYWCTINEPWVIVDAGYQHASHPPGCADTAAALRAARNILLAHGRGTAALRAETDAQVGLVVNIEPKSPVDDDPRNVAAAARAQAGMNHLYLDQVLLGRRPEGIEAVYGDLWTDPTPAELAAISAPLDWLGLNYYTSARVRHDDAHLPDRAATVPVPGHPRTQLGWEIRPGDLRRTLVWLHERYAPPPLLVTENGAALDDPPPGPDGVVPDEHRTAYLRDHVAAVGDAIRAGVDVRGYYAWSLLDNFEWAQGYAPTFGLIQVERRTLARRWKASALAYARMISER